MATTKFTEKDRYGNLRSLEIKTEGNNLEVPPMASGIPQPLARARGGDAETHPGGPKGSDTVPAWLTPGEFVVNKEATDLFGPQIEQMNDIGREIQDGNMNPSSVPQPWNMEIPMYAFGGDPVNKPIGPGLGISHQYAMEHPNLFRKNFDLSKIVPGSFDRLNKRQELINQYADMFGLDPNYLKAVLFTESSGKEDAVGDKNMGEGNESFGLGQISKRAFNDLAKDFPKTYKYTWDEVQKDPEANIHSAAWYLKILRDKYLKNIQNQSNPAGEDYGSLMEGILPQHYMYQFYNAGPYSKNAEAAMNANKVMAIKSYLDSLSTPDPLLNKAKQLGHGITMNDNVIDATNFTGGVGADIPSGNMPESGVFSKAWNKVTDAWENLRWNEGGEIPPAYLNHGGIHLGQPSTWIPGFSGNAPMPTPYDIPSEDELEKAAWLYKKRMQNEESMRELQNAPPMEEIIAQQYANANLGMGEVPLLDGDVEEMEEVMDTSFPEKYRSADTPPPNYGVPPIINPMQDYYNQLAEQEVEGSDTVAGIPLAGVQALDTLTSNADGTFTYNTITYRDNGYGQLIDRYGHTAPHNVQLLYKAKQGDVGGLEQNQNILNDLTKQKENLNKKKDVFVNKHGEAIIGGNLAPNLEKEWQAIEAEQTLLNESTSNLEAKAQNNEATDAAANLRAYENYVADAERFGMPILSFEDWIGRDDTPEETTSILNEDGEVVVPDTIKSTEIKEKKLEKLANQVEDAKLEKMYRHLNRMKSKIDEIHNAGPANPRWEQTKGMLNFLFGDLIDGREIGRAIAIYLGSRALGYTHNDTIGFVAKQYLERVDTKNAQLDKFIRENADKFTQESLAEYKRTKGRSKLIPIGKAPRYQGEDKVYYSEEYPNGRMAYKMKWENADGKDETYYSYSRTGDMPIPKGAHSDPRRVIGTPEYDARLLPMVNQIQKQLESDAEKTGDKYKTGEDKWGTAEWTQHTALNPSASAWSIARWAEENGFRLQDLMINLPQAYNLMVQDTKRKKEEDKNFTKPRDILPYLEDSMIKPLLTSRAAELVTANVNNDVVSTDTEKLKEINRKANQLAEQIGATTTKFWNVVMEEWNSIENDQYKDTNMTHKQEYIKEYDKKKDKGLTPFALFAQDYIDLKFIKINEEKS